MPEPSLTRTRVPSRRAYARTIWALEQHLGEEVVRWFVGLLDELADRLGAHRGDRLARLERGAGLAVVDLAADPDAMVLELLPECRSGVDLGLVREPVSRESELVGEPRQGPDVGIGRVGVLAQAAAAVEDRVVDEDLAREDRK